MPSDMLHNFWVIQGIGALGLLFGVIAWNSKTREKILEFQALNSILFVVHYLLLNALSGAIMSAVVLIRSLVFRKNSAWAQHPAWLYIFIAISVGVVVVFWQGWHSLLPVCGVIIGTYAISKKDPKDIRILMLTTILFWTPYVIIVQSYSGMITQVVLSAGILSGILRHDRKKKPAE